MVEKGNIVREGKFSIFWSDRFKRGEYDSMDGGIGLRGGGGGGRGGGGGGRCYAKVPQKKFLIPI